MIRILLLLTPIYVSLFWVITLAGNRKTQSEPRKFLSIFMIFPLICMLSHFFYFFPIPTIFPYFEPPLALFGSLLFPVLHIYFRLLTVDEKFSFRKHYKYIVFPAIIPLIYITGILLTPTHEYRIWLSDENAFPNSPSIRFLEIMRTAIRIVFLILLFVTFILNFILLKKHEHKAEEFYSDLVDVNKNNAKLLNYSLIIISLTSFVAIFMGRQSIISNEIITDIIWIIVSASIYFIGYMGNKLKPVKPTFQLGNETVIGMNDPQIVLDGQPKILTKLLQEFEENKMYLNSNLNIMDVVQAIGTNRTYLSLIINQRFDKNFCNWVNSYRIEELEQVFSENPNYTYDTLAELCGFGSVNSMKRAVLNQTGKSMPEWKKQNVYLRQKTKSKQTGLEQTIKRTTI